MAICLYSLAVVMRAVTDDALRTRVTHVPVYDRRAPPVPTPVTGVEVVP